MALRLLATMIGWAAAIPVQGTTGVGAKTLGFVDQSVRDSGQVDSGASTDRGIGEAVIDDKLLGGTHLPLCKHCGHHCGGNCGGGNNMNFALNGALEGETGRGILGPAGQAQPAEDTILIHDDVDDGMKVKENADEANVLRYRDQGSQTEKLAENTRNSVVGSEQAYAIEERLDDLAGDEEDGEQPVMIKQAEEDSKEENSSSVAEQIAELNYEADLAKEKPPHVENTVSESIEDIQEADNALEEEITPIVDADEPVKKEVFCEEVAEEAGKAAHLKNEVQRKSQQLKIRENETRLEDESADAEAALIKESKKLEN